MGKTFKYHYSTGYFNLFLPKGCRYCLAGMKIVIFITGICLDRCWYCPVSKEKIGRDVVFVDEEPVKNIDDIVLEAYKINAFGAGITGGDPIFSIERTHQVIKELKKEFGNRFHVHLYTSGRLVDDNILGLLYETGLDEIRFHVYSYELLPKVEKAVAIGFDVGVEVPFIPTEDYVLFLKNLIVQLEQIGVKFININELEVSESNIENIILHGLRPRGLTVENTWEKLKEFLSWCETNVKKLAVHFCTLSFKDKVQFRRRMFRKAVNTIGVHEIATREGTNISIMVKNVYKIDEDIFISFLGKNYVLPTECYRLKGKGIKALITEHYPFSKTVLNERCVVY